MIICPLANTIIHHRKGFTRLTYMNQTKSAKKKSSKQPLSFLANSKEYRCKYHLPRQTSEAEYGCPFEVEGFEREPYCVFHFPKSSAAEKKQMSRDELTTLAIIEEKFHKNLKELILYSESKDFVDLRGFQFPEDMSFRKDFSVKVDFSDAVFWGYIIFGNELYDINRENGKKVATPILKKGACFDNCLFKDELRFQGLNIEGSISFNHAVFEGSTFFLKSNCTGEVEFNSATFKNHISFHHVFFNQINFNFAKFKDEAHFSVMELGLSADFSFTEFDKSVIFTELTVGKNVIKSLDVDQDYKSVCKFIYTIFNEDASFSKVTFNTQVTFWNTIFTKRTIFNQYTIFNDTSEFWGVVLPKDEPFIFVEIDLSKTSFLDTNLEKITFRYVTWARETNKIRKLLRGRSYVLWDEIRSVAENMDKSDESKIAENYRQLVINYESKRDYETAEQFHIGEMEMRRRKVSEHSFYFWHQIRKYLNGYGMYWLSSRYGTSYTQAILVLLMLMSIFSFLFMFSGVKTSKDVSTDNPRIIEYNVFQDSDHILTSPVKFLSDYKETLSYTLSIITFQKERFYEPLDWQARYLLYLAVFTLTAQSALIFLAIRRQFKR